MEKAFKEVNCARFCIAVGYTMQSPMRWMASSCRVAERQRLQACKQTLILLYAYVVRPEHPGLVVSERAQSSKVMLGRLPGVGTPRIRDPTLALHLLVTGRSGPRPLAHN